MLCSRLYGWIGDLRENVKQQEELKTPENTITDKIKSLDISYLFE